MYSPPELREQLYQSKKLGDSKIFEGEILEFKDHAKCVVKVGKKKINLRIEDISKR